MAGSSGTGTRPNGPGGGIPVNPGHFRGWALGSPVHGHYDVVVIGGGISGVQIRPPRRRAQAVTAEGALTLVDVLDRRLVLGALGLVPAEAVRRAAGTVAPLLGWNAEQTAVEVAEYLAGQQQVQAVLGAYPASHPV